MSRPKWWQAIPVGATLIKVDSNHGVAVFESDDDGELTRWTVDLWTDNVFTGGVEEMEAAFDADTTPEIEP